uniref:Receptor kinase, putative, expressed n=1 Tax=Oryza sativa subsp. japonica TaxID=39947 RepID=H2KWA0_ORYSJ|nr:receptor kinase, putative, expressed [Oryza sativa Japonica Group]
MARSLALLMLLFNSSLLLPPASSDDDAAAAAVPTGGAAADELALLSFRSSLVSQGGSSLASWNTTSGHGQHCTWAGVACGGRRDRVVELRLRSFNLSGTISPSLGNLSFLAKLHLGGNHLSGEIPPELGRLSRLRRLNMSGNSLQGSIPAAIGGCFRLIEMDLTINQLEEYGVGNIASTHGDIYSYGILVLETVSGKRPTDTTFGPGLSLRQYVEPGLHGRLMDVVDRKLVLDSKSWVQTPDISPCKEINECLVSLLRLGLSCSQELPSSRMQTGDVISELHDIKESLSMASIM